MLCFHLDTMDETLARLPECLTQEVFRYIFVWCQRCLRHKLPLSEYVVHNFDDNSKYCASCLLDDVMYDVIEGQMNIYNNIFLPYARITKTVRFRFRLQPQCLRDNALSELFRKRTHANGYLMLMEADEIPFPYNTIYVTLSSIKESNSLFFFFIKNLEG